jgi:hypothetical protein
MAASAASVTPYLRVTNERIRDPNLKPGPHRLYLVLCSYAWKAPKIVISQTKLAADCNVTVRTIRRWTQTLEAAGYLRVYEKQGCSHYYELLVDWKPRDPGQMIRLGAEVPRTEDQRPARPPGQIARDQLPFPERTPTETIQKEGRQTLPTSHKLWEQACQQLAQELTKANYTTWIAPLRVADATADSLTLQAPERYIREWVETRLRSAVDKAVLAAAGRRLVVRLV